MQNNSTMLMHKCNLYDLKKQKKTAAPNQVLVPPSVELRPRFHQNYPEKFVPGTFFPSDLLLAAFP